jgi:hypothetical protein
MAEHMTEQNARTPNSDPEALGLPAYADDDSTANDEPESVREADGPEPAALPPDREDGPLAIDDYGVTATEEETGESLDERLARERPDVHAPPENARLTPEELDLMDQPPVQPNPQSPVSMYDRTGPEDSVGRLVAPDEGGLSDKEPAAVASDSGMSGGGESAEESAVHPILDEDEPRPGEPGDGGL